MIQQAPLMSWQEALQHERDFFVDKEQKLLQLAGQAQQAPVLQEIHGVISQAYQVALQELQALESDLARLYYAAYGQAASSQDMQLLSQIPSENMWAGIQWLGAKRITSRPRPSEIFINQLRQAQGKLMENIGVLISQQQANAAAFSLEIGQICTLLSNFECTPIDKSAGSFLKKIFVPVIGAIAGFAAGRFSNVGKGLTG